MDVEAVQGKLISHFKEIVGAFCEPVYHTDLAQNLPFFTILLCLCRVFIMAAVSTNHIRDASIKRELIATTCLLLSRRAAMANVASLNFELASYVEDALSEMLQMA